jgi:hypothetical protein
MDEGGFSRIVLGQGEYEGVHYMALFLASNISRGHKHFQKVPLAVQTHRTRHCWAVMLLNEKAGLG